MESLKIQTAKKVQTYPSKGFQRLCPLWCFSYIKNKAGDTALPCPTFLSLHCKGPTAGFDGFGLGCRMVRPNSLAKEALDPDLVLPETRVIVSGGIHMDFLWGTPDELDLAFKCVQVYCPTTGWRRPVEFGPSGYLGSWSLSKAYWMGEWIDGAWMVGEWWYWYSRMVRPKSMAMKALDIPDLVLPES